MTTSASADPSPLMLNEASQLRDYESLKLAVRGDWTTASIAENEPGHTLAVAAPLDERLIQMIWHEQLLQNERLHTATGKPVRVIDPGQWNGERGPDFRNADLEIGGTRSRGDVEIHIHASDWDRHEHHRDFEYNRVILHVVLHTDVDSRTEIRHNGTALERLELQGVLNPDLDTIRRSLAGEDFLYSDRSENSGAHTCSPAVNRLDPNMLRDFLEAAARQRMETKIERFAAQLRGESADQVLYQAVMTAMGYKGGKTLFFLLAKRAPIEELKRYLRNVPLPEVPLALECILLNVANLAQPTAKRETGGTCAPDLLLTSDGELPCPATVLDAETLDYLNELSRHWAAYAGYFSDRIIPPTRRWFGSVRPVNFPTRRIAGVARLLANFDFRRGLVQSLASRVKDAHARQPRTARDFKREIAALAQLFAAEGSSYWSNHYTLGGKPAARPMQLIGEERALSVLFNALFPMMLLHARETADSDLEAFTWRLFAHFPALPENAVTRFMRHRLFGPAGHLEGWTFRLEKHNQALYQVFHECCSNAALTCENCLFRAPTEQIPTS